MPLTTGKPGATYGTIPLATCTPEIADVIAANITVGDTLEFLHPAAPGVRRGRWASPHDGHTTHWTDRPVKIGSLYWPWGASRFAVGHFLATSSQLAAIRQRVYPTSSNNGYVAQTLTLDDGEYSISTSLWMLPPRPLFQIDPIHLPVGAEQLYLLTLVDVRYWWWERAASIVIDGGTTTWATLFSSIATGLGETISTGSISANYVKPSEELTSRYEALPLLLDAACRNVGHRLVRSLAGAVTTQTATTAITSQDAQLTSWPKQGGGLFAFTTNANLAGSGAPHDMAGLIPDEVTVVFPRTDDGIPTEANPVHVESVSLTSLALTQFPAGFTGHDGSRIFHTSCVAEYVSAAQVNGTETDNLAQRIATDYYLWQLGRQATRFAGIVAYAPEGFHDLEWRIVGGGDGQPGECYTEVMRAPWDDGIEELNHYGAATGGEVEKCCGGIYVYGGDTYITNEFYTTNNVTFTGSTTVTFNSTVDVYLKGDVIFQGAIHYNVATASWSSSQNNYAVSATANWLIVNVSADINLTGIAAPSIDARVLIIYNDGSETLTIVHNSGSSSSANQISTPTGNDYKVQPGESVYLIYHLSDTKWKVWHFGAPQNITHATTYENSITFAGAVNLTEVTVAWSSNQDNYAIASTTNWLYANVTADIDLTGIVAPTTNRVLFLTNIGTHTLTIKNLATSTAANQFKISIADDLIVKPEETIILIYNLTDSRWNVSFVGYPREHQAINVNKCATFKGCLNLTKTEVTWSSDQNDYAITSTTNFLLVTTSTSTINLTGIAPPSSGNRVVFIVNVGDQILQIPHESGSSTAEYRIVTDTGTTQRITPGEFAVVIYDDTEERWRVTPIGVPERIAKKIIFEAGVGLLESNVSFTGNTDNYAVGSAVNFVRLSSDGAYNWTGIAAPSPEYNRVIIWTNVGANTITIKNDATSTAANRFFTPDAGDMAIETKRAVITIYDTTSDRWRAYWWGEKSTAGSTPAFAGARVWADSVNQTINSSASAAISYDTERYDTDAFYGGSGSDLTIPADFDGYYAIGCYIQWSATNTTGDVQIQLRVNGTDIIAGTFSLKIGGAKATLHTEYALGVGDDIDVYVSNATDVTINIDSAECWLHKIGGA